MRALFFVALFVVSGTSFSGGQQATPSTPPTQAPAQPVRIKVYAVGPGVTAPVLLPVNQPPIPDEKCKKNQKENEEVVLSVLVDTAGKPRNVMFLRPSGTEMDNFALQLVAADRFNPGTHEGASVVVGQTVDVKIQVCVDEKKDENKIKTFSLRVISQPEQNFGALAEPLEEAVLASDEPSSGDSSSAPRLERVGKGVSAPVLLSHVDAEFSDEARKAGYQGACVVSMVVDTHGRPQNIQVVRALGMGLDEKAIEAVSRYRFKPAMKDGAPVPVKMNVEIVFRLSPGPWR